VVLMAPALLAVQTVSALAPGHHADLCGGACYNDTRVEVAAL
jgi:hypothetical protein